MEDYVLPTMSFSNIWGVSQNEQEPRSFRSAREPPHDFVKFDVLPEKIDALLAALCLCRCKQGKTCFLLCFDKFVPANKGFLPPSFIGGLKKNSHLNDYFQSTVIYLETT